MTIQIKRLTAIGNGDVIGIDIEIEHDGNSQRTAFKILSSQYAKMKIAKGEISQSDFEEIEAASEICEAYLRAVNILSFGSNTAHTLILKLRRRGIDSDAAKEAVEMLRIKGYINEDGDLRREIERCLRKLWGSRRIMAHLHSKGYEDEALSAAEDELSEIDFGEICLELLESKCDEIPNDPKDRQKLIASLSRYGYSMSEIKYALSNFSK